jgi:preprotein translocase subunit SecF
MFIVKYRKIFYALSALLIGISIASVLVFGLKQGIDFKGGSILELSFVSEQIPTVESIKNTISGAGFGEVSVRPSEAGSFVIRLKTITPAEKDIIVGLLSSNNQTLVVKGFNAIGPTLGNEAKTKSAVSIILVLIAIILFIAFAFRKVSKPISSWTYGFVAIIALLHDVIIPIGVFSILGHYFGFEVDTLFVTALLVILGFSIHDTIVVFDRVRENLSKDSSKKDFSLIVGESISQTFARSINTSLTTLLSITALYIWGPVSTHHFALALLIGITVGTYSSIFIGSPLLVTIGAWKAKK